MAGVDVTPTANKLYQLVHKGSMSAPTGALNQFWSALCERSRVSVEHADLPHELKSTAGEMVAAVWKTAQTMARDSVAKFDGERTATGKLQKTLESERAQHVKLIGRSRAEQSTPTPHLT